MNNNILKQIEPNIIKVSDASYTSIDMCIKQNNIFCILFISNFLPDFNDIIIIFKDLLNSMKQDENNNNIFTLIICICDEEKEDFDITLKKLSEVSCFIIPFDSKERQNLINNYNIITLPSLLIFDKNGKNIGNLNYNGIKDINLKKIEGWKKTLNIINNVKTEEKYFIGMEGTIYGHSHILFYADYLSKSPNYGKSNWQCDICGKSHTYLDTNFYCDLCGYNVCDSCFEKNRKF